MTVDTEELSLTTRQAVMAHRKSLHQQAAELAREASEMTVASPERNTLYRGVQEKHAAKAHLEAVLANDFMPAHGTNQLISPRVFFMSPLFRVASKRIERERTLSIALRNSDSGLTVNYTGPELRQSDGLVFMVLLNLAKDDKLGSSVKFYAEDICKKAFGRYDGPTRKQLRTHIQRLQRGLLEFDSFSVQLCKRFDYPSRGSWSVELDPDIVKVFQQSCEIWLDFDKRKALPEGLTTWLYGFIESQTRLIPMPANTLRQMCGSDAHEESFLRTLRIALRELASQNLIEPEWTVQGGIVRWKKAQG